MENLTQQVHQLLLQSISSNDAEIKAAEKALKQLHQAPGFVNHLTSLMTSDMDINLRLSAAIYFKNLVTRDWQTIQNVPNLVFPDPLKDYIRKNLFQTMVVVPKGIELQLGEAFYTIVKFDYPSPWNTIIDEVVQMIATQEPARIRCALYILRVVAKRYEYAPSGSDKKEQSYRIIETTFPVLEKLFQYVVTLNSPVAVEMEILILKIFWSFTEFGVPPYFLQADKFQQWIQIFVHILHRPVPVEVEPKDADEKFKFGPWKVKHWVVKIFERYVSRFSVARKGDNDTVKEFCAGFMDQYIINILEVCLNFIGGPLAARAVPSILTNIISYINSCLYHSKTWQFLKPHVGLFFQNILFPLLCNIQDDIDNFEQDPQEFIRLEFDFNQDFIAPRNSVTSFIVDLIKLRGNEFLDLIMNHCSQVLNRYSQVSPQEKNYAEKHAVLLIISTLYSILINSPTYRDGLEDLLNRHVFTEFDNPLGFMRARAILVFGKFYHLKFKNTEGFYKAINFLVNSLQEKNLPISVFSAVSIQGFIKSKSTRPVIEQVVPQLLDAFLRLMNQVDNDELVGTLDLLIYYYSDHLKQHLPEVTARIVQNYSRIIAKGNEIFEDDDSSSFLTVIELLRTLLTILENTKTVKEIYAQIEPLFIPLLLCIDEPLIDLFPDYIQILTYLTYYGEISDGLWQVFDKYVQIYFGWGSEYLSDLLKPFDNFISRSNEKFLSRGSIDRIWEIFKHTLENQSDDNLDLPYGCDLIEVVFIYSRGKVDNLLSPVLELTLKKLITVELDVYKVSLLQVVANALYYHPVMTLTIMESNGLTMQVFKLWFSLLNTSFKRRHNIKITIMGLSALLYIPFAQWPQNLQPQLKNIISALMELCKKYMKIKEEESNASGESVSSDFNSESEGEEMDAGDETGTKKKKTTRIYRDDEDVEPDILSGEIFSKLAGLYEDDDSDNVEDDYDFSTLLDEIDEVVFFLEAFQSISTRDQGIYQQLLSTFSPEEQSKLQELAAEANQRQSAKNKNT